MSTIQEQNKTKATSFITKLLSSNLDNEDQNRLFFDLREIPSTAAGIVLHQYPLSEEYLEQYGHPQLIIIKYSSNIHIYTDCYGPGTDVPFNAINFDLTKELAIDFLTDILNNKARPYDEDYKSL